MTRLRALVLCLLLWPLWAQAAQVQASLDRNQVQLGETVTLNLRVEGGGMAPAPDLSALQGDFDVLGNSSNTSVSIVNGQRSVDFSYGIALRPKHVGQLVIPALEVGGSYTRPLTLQVVPPNPSPAASHGRDVFLEASATPGQVHVGQQLVFTVRLYFAGSLSSGSLDELQLPGVDARRLGNDLDYDAVRDGRTYHVIERRYALIPQHAGAIVLPALDFQGELVDPNDPDSFFNIGTPSTAASPPVTIQVQPIPPSWGASAWLPARALELTLDGLPADGTLHVGQPLDLTMTLQATGLPYEALPELSLPSIEGATVYPDKPVTSTRNDGQWLLGRRQRNFAMVPSRAGTLTLPAISLKWWNVQTGQAEEARIPARTLTVLPGAAAPAAPAATPKSATSATAPTTTVLAPRTARTPAWRVLVFIGVALLLVLGASAVWWVWRLRRPVDPRVLPGKVSLRALRATFMATARGGDPAAQAHALLAWARAERPGLASLGALAEALALPIQREAIESLQRRRFAAEATTPGPDLAAAFARGFQWRTPGAGDEPPLPPLYPFKLR